MPRFALKIEYNGDGFAGWQRQSHAPSVQQCIEEALARLEPQEMRIQAAGRTDAGVHATGQVAHCDLVRDWEPFRLSEALNYHLKPAAVAISACARVADDFNARFDAVERRYVYRVISRRAPPVFDIGRVWHVRHALDLTAMQAGAAHLIGHHDFTTFRASECQAKSPMRTLDLLKITKQETRHGHEYQFDVRARSFLHSQVRSFVGTLERVGAGAWPPDRMGAALRAADRAQCGPVAPPSGLYLSHVVYPEPVFV